jgi:hypothetical protein
MSRALTHRLVGRGYRSPSWRAAPIGELTTGSPATPCATLSHRNHSRADHVPRILLGLSRNDVRALFEGIAFSAPRPRDGNAIATKRGTSAHDHHPHQQGQV